MFNIYTFYECTNEISYFIIEKYSYFLQLIHKEINGQLAVIFNFKMSKIFDTKNQIIFHPVSL